MKLKAIKNGYMENSNEQFITSNKIYNVVHDDGEWIGIIDDRNKHHYFVVDSEHEGYYGNWFEVV